MRAAHLASLAARSLYQARVGAPLPRGPAASMMRALFPHAIPGSTWIPSRPPLTNGRVRGTLGVRCMATAAGTARTKHVYVCKECKEQTAQWSGQCTACGAWGTMDKVAVLSPAAESGGGGGGGARAAARFVQGQASGRMAAPASSAQARRGQWVEDSDAPQRLSDVSQRGFGNRWRLQLPGSVGSELGRVLGGGVVPGSVLLVGGEPGVGKSTLLLQVAALLAKVGQGGDDGRPVLYVSGEESTEQIGSRAERMGMGPEGNNIFLYSATRLDSILAEIARLNARAVIVDSIQTVYLDEIPSSAGSVTQVRECTTALLRVAKGMGVPMFLVGHVTKSGEIAGPRVLEHIVDVVLYMEGGRQSPVRLIRGVKNRYGATEEVGVFQMFDDGMQVVADPSSLFLTSREISLDVSSAVTVTMEGSRPMLMEVQALCTRASQGPGLPPTRVPSGVKRERMQLILAVLSKHTDMKPFMHDIHLNVTGGLIMAEPATDLAVALAIASSYYDRAIPRELALIGEVGLGGELRQVPQTERRLAEAAKLGFTRAVVPPGGSAGSGRQLAKMQVQECRTLAAAISAVLGGGLAK
ncbi:hypothetical protein ACKKBG_A17420 [Auxenochlorella protothecoides x Auxenochlorella symbiontica]